MKRFPSHKIVKLLRSRRRRCCRRRRRLPFCTYFLPFAPSSAMSQVLSHVLGSCLAHLRPHQLHTSLAPDPALLSDSSAISQLLLLGSTHCPSHPSSISPSTFFIAPLYALNPPFPRLPLYSQHLYLPRQPLSRSSVSTPSSAYKSPSYTWPFLLSVPSFTSGLLPHGVPGNLRSSGPTPVI